MEDGEVSEDVHHTSKDQERSEVDKTSTCVKQKERVAASLAEEEIDQTLTTSLLLGLTLSHGELGSHHCLESNRGHFLKTRTGHH